MIDINNDDQDSDLYTYLSGLNAQQKEAVLHVDGPLLILAGAGTGKTRVLISRIIHIMRTKDVSEKEILAVTFTNKAAQEMQKRLFLASHMSWPFVGTFHAICVKILRAHAQNIGFSDNFDIINTSDKINIIKQLLKEQNIDSNRWSPKLLASKIDGWKNKGLTPNNLSSQDAQGFAFGKGKALYNIYQQRLASMNSMDFGDLLLYCIHLFETNTDIFDYYKDMFKYVLVDEYQDINDVQYHFIKLLSKKWLNVCCVGDDDQSIYGWRGASVKHILHFTKDFKNAKSITLETNYRSRPIILQAASGLIMHNKQRLGKDLKAAKTKASESGGYGLENTNNNENLPASSQATSSQRSVQNAANNKICVLRYGTEEEEASGITSIIQQITRASSMSVQSQDYKIAILVRAGFQMRILEEKLIRECVPYLVVGGPKFYERTEIRDANAYLKILLRPEDDLSFERIINTPKRGLGDSFMRKIKTLSNVEKISFMRACRILLTSDELKPLAHKTLSHFLNLIDQWILLKQKFSLSELMERILEESGYLSSLQKENTLQSESRLDNLKELCNAMKKFAHEEEYLDHIALLTDLEDSSTDKHVVTLMTVHSAKGLEFEHVFLPGFEDGLFPHHRCFDEQGDAGLEEERRLAYVALTRAKKTVIISMAVQKYNHRTKSSPMMSRFIDEIPRKCLEFFSFFYENSTTHQKSPHTFADCAHIESVQHYNNSDRETKKHSSCALSVRHARFGNGHILEKDGNKLTVDFGEQGVKRVLQSFVTQT